MEFTNEQEVEQPAGSGEGEDCRLELRESGLERAFRKRCELADEENVCNELSMFRRQLVNDLLAMAQNNLNSYLEMQSLRKSMIQCMIEPLTLRRRIGRKLRQIREKIREQELVLDNQLTQMKLMSKYSRAESEIDCNLLEGNKLGSYEEFIGLFVEHRKEYHMQKAKIKRLAQHLSDLRRLSDFCDNYQLQLQMD